MCGGREGERERKRGERKREGEGEREGGGRGREEEGEEMFRINGID